MTCLVSSTTAVDLYWLPLGAGDRVVKHCGRLYETLIAAREQRRRCDLYHAALEVHLDGVQHVIESAPTWDRAEPDRGVVVEGAVGLAWLGRWKLFRYEVRRWRDGVIPDAAEAVDSPQRISTDRDRVRRILELAPSFPPRTWGRDELSAGDMWNSNSLVSWLLVRSGHDVGPITPPPGGRAPGWTAGVVAAGRYHPPAFPGPDGSPSAPRVSRSDETVRGRKGDVRGRSQPAGQERP
jgi:hypothetical protein